MWSIVIAPCGPPQNSRRYVALRRLNAIVEHQWDGLTNKKANPASCLCSPNGLDSVLGWPQASHLLLVALQAWPVESQLLRVLLAAWLWAVFQPKQAPSNTHFADVFSRRWNNILDFATGSCKALSALQTVPCAIISMYSKPVEASLFYR
jgi:hypothetical protein